MFGKKLAGYLIIITLPLTFAACDMRLKEGTITYAGMQNASKFWKPYEVKMNDSIVILEKQNARLVSKFSLRNFIATINLKTTGGAWGYVMFHTSGNSDSAVKGYKVLINNTDYRNGNPQKTGSLCLMRNNFVRTVTEDTWFELQVTVRANHITVKVNQNLISEYIEPDNPERIDGLEGMILSSGYIILQKSSDMGQFQVGEINIEALSADIAGEETDPSSPDLTAKALDELNQRGFPLIDFHGHLKGGLTVEEVCRHGRLHGYNYGISPNCGLNFPVTNDSALLDYFNVMKNEPVLKAMQCEGREWITLFTPVAISNFDYIFTDAMTWTDHKGRRMRLWIPEETFVDNEQQFMEMLVGKIEAILNQEPVDIHVNPTYLPGIIAADYQRLWTPERMDRVIKALKDNDVALEINARFKIPSIEFIKRARKAGVKFTFGTNNAGNNDLNRLEYCLEAIREAGLTPEDLFLPRPAGDKKVLKKGLPSKITG